MSTLTVQTSVFGGLNYINTAASTADNFVNDGNTFLLFVNSNASARTLTIAANATSRPGFGSIATPSTVVTLPGNGTNGGLAVVGPFPTERFNDITTGKVSYIRINTAEALGWYLGAYTGLYVGGKTADVWKKRGVKRADLSDK